MVFLSCGFTCSGVSSADSLTTSQILDSRISNSPTFRYLKPLESWETGVKRLKGNNSPAYLYGGHHGIEPDAMHFHRAASLAESGHYAEAVGEYTKGINTVELKTYRDPVLSSQDSRGRSASLYDHSNITLQPTCFISRAKLLLKLGLNKEALLDVERALGLSSNNPETKIRISLLFVQMGLSEQALSALPALDTVQSSSLPVYLYLKGVLQSKLGKFDLAQESLFESASKFFARGEVNEGQACLDALARISRESGSAKAFSMSQLAKPNHNFDKIRLLLKSLATDPDAFEPNNLEAMAGVKLDKKKQYFFKSRSDRKEILYINYNGQTANERTLSVTLDPSQCSVSIFDLKEVLNATAQISDQFKSDKSHVEVYNVPAGKLVFDVNDSGFKSITRVRLMDKEVVFPPDSKAKTSITDDSKLRENNLKYLITSMSTSTVLSLETKADLTNLLEKEPKNFRIHALFADDLFRNGQSLQALYEIDKAISIAKSGKRDEYTNYSTTLDVRKATYLIELKRFDEALALLKDVLPKEPTADQLLLRSRAEIGLGDLASARDDLLRASKNYFEACDIFARDETNSLLESISNSSKVKSGTESFASEAGKAAALLRILEKEQQVKLHKLSTERRERVWTKLAQLYFARSYEVNGPHESLQKALEFANFTLAYEQRAFSAESLDQALIIYEKYLAGDSRHTYLSQILSLLSTLNPDDLISKIEKLASCTERYCGDEEFRKNRDYAFLSVCQNDQNRTAMIEILLKVRKSLSSKTGASVDSLLASMPKSVEPSESQSKHELNFSSNQSQLKGQRILELDLAFEQARKAMHQTDSILMDIEKGELKSSEKLIGQLESPSDIALPVSTLFVSAQHLLIAQAYLKLNALALADRSLRVSVSNFAKSNSDECKPFTSLFPELRKLLYDKKQFKQLEELLDFCLVQDWSDKGYLPRFVFQIKMDLAQVFADQARATSDKSKSFSLMKRAAERFDSCIADCPEYINRSKVKFTKLLSTKYPELGKYISIWGDIVYDEDSEIGAPGSMSGMMEVDGQSMSINGAHDVYIGGSKAGESIILLDGQTLREKGSAKLAAGKLSYAGELFKQFLRAAPDAGTFADLSEVLFLQSKYKLAWQSAAVALDTEPGNVLAAAIHILSIQRLKVPDADNAKYQKLIRAQIDSSPSKADIRTVYYLLALNDTQAARALLERFLKANSESPRVQCLLGKITSETSK